MPLTRDEVYWLYRTILGRNPECEEVYDFHIKTHHNFDNARHTFMETREFQDRMHPPVYYLTSDVKYESFSKPKGICLSTIVKNEEKNIELMLRSCIPVVDYVVVLDTGSTDSTKDVVSRVLHQEGVPFILEEKQFQNFSQARNDALALVPDHMRWALMLDADEHLMPEDYPLFESLLDADIDAWSLPRYSFADSSKQMPVESYPDYQNRLIRVRKDNPVLYTGTMHENISDAYMVKRAPANTTRYSGTTGGPHIHHMGGVTTSSEELARKMELYIRLSHEGLDRSLSRSDGT